MNKDILGIVTNSATVAIKDEDFWQVTQTITQKRTFDGENWEEKEISMSAKDKNLDEAFKQTIMSIAVYLDTIGGDLFAEELVDEYYEEDLANLPKSEYIQ